MKVKIDKQTGAVSILDPADHMLLQESAQARRIAPATQRGIAGNSSAMTFDLSGARAFTALASISRVRGITASAAAASSSLKPT